MMISVMMMTITMTIVKKLHNYGLMAQVALYEDEDDELSEVTIMLSSYESRSGIHGLEYSLLDNKERILQGHPDQFEHPLPFLKDQSLIK